MVLKERPEKPSSTNAFFASSRILRMRWFPFSVAPFSVAPLAGGCKKMCIRRGPPSDRSAPQFGGDLTVPSGNPYRGHCSLGKIYCETQVAGSDLSAAARPAHKIKA